MNLADVLNGNIKVGKHSSITYKGQVYRGEKAIKELAEKEVGNGNDSAPAAPKTTRKRRSSSRSSRKTTQPKQEQPSENDGDQS